MPCEFVHVPETARENSYEIDFIRVREAQRSEHQSALATTGMASPVVLSATGLRIYGGWEFGLHMLSAGMGASYGDVPSLLP